MENINFKEQNRISIITQELDKLSRHIKTYSTGAYPVFLLQLHTTLKLDDILEMRMSDIYRCDNGHVFLKKEIKYNGKIISLEIESRREMAWYALQRIPVKGVKEEQLKDNWLCVNRQGRQLQKQIYRKMLERSSNELNLSRVYNSVYLRTLYGYLEIAYGRKTIDDMAQEYEVERYYLLNRMFKGMEIEYASEILDAVARI